MCLLSNKYTYKISTLKVEIFSPNVNVTVVNKHITYIKNIESATISSKSARIKY